MSERLNFASWQELAPDAAAAECSRRINELPPALRRAVVAAEFTAEQLAERFAQAAAGQPMSRVPCLVKDLFDVGGLPTQAGSTFLAEVRPPRGPGEDGLFAADLQRAGIVVTGKSQMVEFAYGLTGENAHYGDCPHPRFPERVSGGSSSGSAFAVAAGLVPFATGSDTGGSIRVPAAFCGIYGMRLSPYHDWIKDAVPLVPAFDTPGWFTANAGDMHIALDSLLALNRPEGAAAPSMAAPADAAPRRGCYLEIPGLDAEVREACGRAAAHLAPPPRRKLRAALLESFARAESAYQVLGNLAAWETHRGWFGEFAGRYAPATRQRLERAREITPEETAAARHARDAVMRTWEEFFGDFDFLVLPATPCPAQTRDQLTPENRRRLLDLTAPASLGGLPVLTLPLPLGDDRTGLTTGLQVVVREATNPILRAFLRQWEPVAGLVPA